MSVFAIVCVFDVVFVIVIVKWPGFPTLLVWETEKGQHWHQITSNWLEFTFQHCGALLLHKIWEPWIWLLSQGKTLLFFGGKFFQIWVGGWFQNKVQTPQTPPNHPKNRLFRSEFHLPFSQISKKNLGWVGGFTDLGKLFQKIHFFSFDAFPKGSPPQKTKPFFSCESFPKFVYPPNHPRVFVRFGKTKGEIQVKKGDFRVDLGGPPK